jgi:hypothetical protein
MSDFETGQTPKCANQCHERPVQIRAHLFVIKSQHAEEGFWSQAAGGGRS